MAMIGCWKPSTWTLASTSRAVWKQSGGRVVRIFDLRAAPTSPARDAGYVTLAGDLAAINVFDVVQVIENAKLTGTLTLTNETQTGKVLFNDGRIVDAESAGVSAELGFRQIVEITTGDFEFQKSAEGYPVAIHALSNTNLLLDTLRQLDEAKQ